jgi:hypothetical protein
MKTLGNSRIPTKNKIKIKSKIVLKNQKRNEMIKNDKKEWIDEIPVPKLKFSEVSIDAGKNCQKIENTGQETKEEN